MKMILAATAFLFSATAAFAAPHTYQVTGPVLELTDTSITVSKGKDNWKLTRDANTKLPANIKVGSKVTIEYSMTAIDVTDKTPEAKAKPAAKAKK
jgi:hypothetical protein